MDNLEELHAAFLKADAAGDTASARILADHIRSISAPAPPAEKPSGDIGHQLGLFARAGVTGLAGLPNMLGDALNGAINLGTTGVNKLTGTNIPQLGMPSRATQNLMDSAGVAQPQNSAERVVQAASSAVAGVNPSIALGKLISRGAAQAPAVFTAADVARKAAPSTAQAVGAALQAAPGMQVIGSAGAGAGGALAAEAGGGIGAQLAASLLGGMAGVGVASGITAAGKRAAAPTQAQQLAQALRDRSNNAMPDTEAWPIHGDGPPAPPPAAPRDLPPLEWNGRPPGAGNITATPELTPPVPAPLGGMLNSERQLSNIDIMRKIGLNEQRPSAISGDKFTAGQEYDNAKLNNGIGEVARTQLAKEQSTLTAYADGIVRDTGAPVGTPEAAGQSIRAPLQGLSDHFDTEVGKLYDAAKTNAGGMGAVNPKNLGTLIGNNDFRESLLSSPAGTTLLGAIERQIKRFQGIPVEGETLPPAPATVNSAENLRKWLNAQWSPGNSRLIGQVKEAIDLDVAGAGGKGVFDQARALHGMRRDTLDNPNGISKLLSIEGPKGINQTIPDELVGPKLLAMPTGQFKHIIDTINGLPPALQEQGQQAIAEIRAALARRIYAAGDTGGTQNGPSTWNAANVTREMNAQRSKMAIVFTPAQLDSLQTLHDAGHILQTPSAYKGAAAQGYNYLQSGAIAGLPAAGGALGAMLGGPLGAGVGGAAGTGVAVLAKKSIDSSMAAKYAEALRNPRPQFPPP